MACKIGNWTYRDYEPPPARTTRISVAEIRRRIRRIAREPLTTGDRHEEMDRLYIEVLECIAQGLCSDPKKVAAAALRCEKVDFSRWFS